jgi:hypothetical protein
LDERAQTIACLVLIALGCLLRELWILHRPHAQEPSPAFYIARALAEGRGFSEAFGPGTGPTAHLMPTTPLFAAMAYKLFGVGAPVAEIVLGAWALSQFALSVFLADRVMGELGASRWGRLAGVAVVCVLPLQFPLEAVRFRVWEVGVATCALLAITLATLRLDKRPTIGRWPPLLLGLANGVTFVISPTAAIATSGVIGLFFLRRLPVRRWVAPVLAAVAVAATVLVPWGMRNEHVLGKFVPLRTGEGISLAIGYNPTRLHATDRLADELRRHEQVSPMHEGEARRRYLQIGEVAYNAELRQEATAWMKAHPGEAWALRARNAVEFYAPPEWAWIRLTAGDIKLLGLRHFVVVLSAILGLLALVAGALARRPRWLYLFPALLLPSLPYIATFPLLRYRYCVSTLLILLAVEGVVWLATAKREGVAAA